MAADVEGEIVSQPEDWRRAGELAAGVLERFPEVGARTALVGCGTSLFIAQVYAARREAAGQGLTDAFPASEMPGTRTYDRVIALSRSGTTSEVVRCLGLLPAGMSTLAVTAVANSPVANAASRAIVLDFADERSVVQTRFATTALALMRATLGEDLGPVVADGERALARPLPGDLDAYQHFVFLGRGWTVGLAHEAALKMREAAAAWSESYPAMEYRHGPISVAGPHSLVWSLGGVDDALLRDVRSTGATVVAGGLDPMAELVVAQRAAVALAMIRGLDPDRPRHLTRSVVLPG